MEDTDDNNNDDAKLIAIMAQFKSHAIEPKSWFNWGDHKSNQVWESNPRGIGGNCMLKPLC